MLQKAAMTEGTYIIIFIKSYLIKMGNIQPNNIEQDHEINPEI